MAPPASKAIERYLDTVGQQVRENVTIVTPETLGQDTLFHISTSSKVKLFRPEVSRRTATKEDRSIPRISTAPTIAGCIQGYQADIFDFNSMQEKNYYHGGWYIYGFPFDYAIRPKSKILVDVEKTDEHWLVPYEANRWEVEGRIYGKFFYGQVNMFWKDRKHYVERECYVEVGRLGDIVMAKGTRLTAGYYRLTLTAAEFMTKWSQIKVKDLEKISASDFRAVKKVSADLLSHQELPPSAHW